MINIKKAIPRIDIEAYFPFLLSESDYFFPFKFFLNFFQSKTNLPVTFK